METKKRKVSLATGLILLVVLIVAVALTGLFLLPQPPLVLQGEAEATQIRISGKLPGRVMEFMVTEGEHVEVGDTLVHIYSAIAEAQLFSANAMHTAAEAENRKVDAGAREEVIHSAQELMLQAQAALTIAEKSYRRIASLYEKGVVSEQRRDEALAAYDMARAAESAARSQYEMAAKGARREEKTAAAALAAAAAGGVAEVEALLEDSYLTATHTGEVSEIFPAVGELVSLGAPIMNIVILNDMWVSFNVREDLLQDLAVGNEVTATIPALENRSVRLKVYQIKDMGTYAVWRATKATGEYDAKTFNVKARPTQPVEGLRPGMSVLLEERKR